MEVLSVAASIAGLLSASGEIARLLGPYVSAATGTPQITAHVHAEVQSAAVILSALQDLAQNLASAPTRHAELIHVDQVVAVLTDGVLLFSELERALQTLPLYDPLGQRLPLRSRLQWARKEGTFTALLTRLQGFKSSISLMLMILKSDSDRLATQHQQDLSININTLLQSNIALSRRLMNLEDALDTQTIASRRRSLQLPIGDEASSVKSQGSNLATPDLSRLSIVPERKRTSYLDFKDDLESSWVYRRAQRDTMDFSFRSSVTRTNAWSIFSDLSLGDISAMSVIALPIFQEDLANAEHYDFGAGIQIPSTVEPLQSKQALLLECLEIQLQLCQIPGFSELFEEVKELSLRGEGDDAFFTLWAVFRKGYPLLMLLHALDERFAARSDPGHSTEKKAKKAIYDFLRACTRDLLLPVESLFTVADLLGIDALAFLRVIKVLSSIIEMLKKADVVSTVNVSSALSESSHDMAVEDFLSAQRSFVQQLEQLAEIKSWIEIDGTLLQDKVHEIFGNLRPLVDMHIQLLIRMERNLFQPTKEQRWQSVFVFYYDFIGIESTFLVNEKRARHAIRSCLDKKSHGTSEQLTRSLATCLKLFSMPSQRVLEYIAFVQDLRRQDGQSDDQSNAQRDDLDMAFEFLQKALVIFNSAIKDEETREARVSLIRRVVDWKLHKPEQFGELVLFDSLNVTTQRTIRKFHVYLFDVIILFCSEEHSQQPFWGIFSTRAKATQDSSRSNISLRGRIYCLSIKKVFTILKPGQGEYTSEIWWRENGELQSFKLHFSSESQCELWRKQLEEFRDANARYRTSTADDPVLPKT